MTGGPNLPAGDAAQHVLVVEDDPGMRMLLLRVLKEDGYRVTGAQHGRDMWASLEAGGVDLVFLDIGLPGVSGLDLCRELRRTSAVPVIIISARGEETDRVLGLELGADDYIAKPFGRKELLARTRAVLRRGPLLADAASRTDRHILRFAGWTLDLRRRVLLAPGEVVTELSGAEFDLLVSFLENPQRVIGRERLLELSRTRLGDVADRSVDVLVSRLRRKLTLDGKGDGGEQLIRTVRGVGYILSADVTRD